MTTTKRLAGLISLLAAATLIVAMVACDDDEDETTQAASPEPAVTVTPAEEPAETPEATPTPVPDVDETPAEAPSPRFDPQAGTCVDTPPLEAAGDFDPAGYTWQVSAPRQPTDTVLPGDSAQVGLRIKLGTPSDVFDFTAQVIDPAGGTSQADAVLQSDSWTYLDYPTDFGASPTVTGTYTVIYDVAGTFVACDGFVVETP